MQKEFLYVMSEREREREKSKRDRYNSEGESSSVTTLLKYVFKKPGNCNKSQQQCQQHKICVCIQLYRKCKCITYVYALIFAETNYQKKEGEKIVKLMHKTFEYVCV